MGNVCNADWGLIQQMVVNGVPLKEISQETGVKQGTIAARASRASWKALATKAKAFAQSVTVTNEAKPQAEAKLEAASERTRQRLARFVERCSEKLEDMPLPTPKSAVIASQEAEALMRSAKTVFAWGEALAQPAIRIQVVAQCRLASEPNPAGYVPSQAVPVAKESILLPGPMGTGPEGAKPLLGGVVEVNKPPHNFPTLEIPEPPQPMTFKTTCASGPVLNVASDVVPPVAEDYCI